jgi:cytochrome c oxidase assembly protein subunit 15
MGLVTSIQLALIGATIAAMLLLFSWWKNKKFTFHRLVLLTLFFTFDLILFGAFTRLTDSGLGCPDWPGCYGVSNPLVALNHIRAAEAVMPTGPVTLSKAWIEMLHRYFAMAVGLLLITMLIWSWVQRRVLGVRIFSWSFLAFLMVCLQGAFGAWTVTLKLQPIIVTTHLMLGITFLSTLAYLSNLSGRAEASVFLNQSNPIYAMNRSWVWIGIAALSVQIFLGAWVSTNYAVLACDDFPLCHGQLFPVMDFKMGFGLWRELGKATDGQILTIDALRAIHWTHRLGALGALAVLFSLSYKTIKTAMMKGHPVLRRWGFALFGLCVLQVLTGMSNIVLDWPLLAALLHTGGAAAMMVVLIRLLTLRKEAFA